MGQLRAFARLVASAPRDRADFLLVYIAEAHPTDGWMYPAVEAFAHRRQHTRLGERLQAARVLRTKAADAGLSLAGDASGAVGSAPAPVRLFADGMGNSASRAFGALPERLAIVLDGQVRFIGGKGPEEYSMPEAAAALSALLRKVELPASTGNGDAPA